MAEIGTRRTTPDRPAAERLIESLIGRFVASALETSAVDFAAPAGEPALAAPDSVTWRVFKNPLALYVGGVTAVILELGEPRVRAGVWEHGTFRSDPLARIERTGLAAMVTVYGARSVAQRMIAGVRRLHERVQGRTPAGVPYRATDPELLDWVHATASFGFLEAYRAYVAPLAAAERDRFYADGLAAARLYGATGAPSSSAALEAQFAAMRPKLEASPIIVEFLDVMRRAAILPWPARRLQGTLVRAAIDLVPPRMRARFELAGTPGLSGLERPLVCFLGRVADRLVVPSSPPVQACRRLGLPDDHLYRRSSEP